MEDLKGKRVLITGGSHGLGLGTVEVLTERGAQVMVLARDRRRLSELARRTGVAVQAGDATDGALMEALVAELQPAVLILNAGAPPCMAPIDEQTWESFCAVWNTDVKAGLYGIQAALKAPMPPGGRVLIVSGGFAVAGAPLGGGSAGAKRMLWFMAEYANSRAAELGLDVRFQVLLPLQPPWGSGIGERVAAWYAERQGVSVESILAARQHESLPPERWGEHIVDLLSDPRYASGVAYGISSDAGAAGITQLDPAAPEPGLAASSR